MSRASSIIESVKESAPSLPEGAVRLLQLISDPHSSDDELLLAVRAEPLLTKNVLRLSNSSLYSLPKEVVDVSQTVAYLGGRTLVRMVVALCACPAFARGGSPLEIADSWRHALACGITAQLLAEMSGAVDPRCAFTAGVLHDIGTLALIPLSSTESTHEKLLAETQASRRGFVATERKVLGIDHATVGSSLAEGWRLPRSVIHAIRYHHDPEMASEDELAPIVHVADALVLQMGIGVSSEGLSYPLSAAALRRVDLETRELDRVRLLLLDELLRSEDLLRLSRKLNRVDGAA